VHRIKLNPAPVLSPPPPPPRGRLVNQAGGWVGTTPPGRGSDTPGLADRRTGELLFSFCCAFSLLYFYYAFSTPRTGSQVVPDWVPLDSAVFCKDSGKPWTVLGPGPLAQDRGVAFTMSFVSLQSALFYIVFTAFPTTLIEPELSDPCAQEWGLDSEPWVSKKA